MTMKEIICVRHEEPSTCVLCQMEGKDYCFYCADNEADINRTSINVQSYDPERFETSILPFNTFPSTGNKTDEEIE